MLVEKKKIFSISCLQFLNQFSWREFRITVDKKINREKIISINNIINRFACINIVFEQYFIFPSFQYLIYIFNALRKLLDFISIFHESTFALDFFLNRRDRL